MVKVTIAGKLTDGTFQQCKKAAEFLQANVDGFHVTILSLLPADYELFLAQILPAFPDITKHNGNVITYSGDPNSGAEYIGAKAKFVKWCGEQYGYVDSTHKIMYERLAKKHMRSVMAKNGRQYADIDIAIDGRKEGRITVELFTDICPKTCENFIGLLKGSDAGTYVKCPFHRIVPDGWIQSGDVVDGTGKGGASVFGPAFADECFAVKHDKPGILGMANSGPHTNSSQFYITAAPLAFLDGKKVAFGRVIDGLRTIKVISKLETVNERPKKQVTIEECSMWSLDAMKEE